MALETLFREVREVTVSEIVIPCLTKQVCEHIWIYFEFSFDPEFKNAEDFVLPDSAGAYNILTSENGKYYATWITGQNVTIENYIRQYKIAGYVKYVKVAVTSTPVTTTPPPTLGAPLYVRVTVAKV